MSGQPYVWPDGSPAVGDELTIVTVPGVDYWTPDTPPSVGRYTGARARVLGHSTETGRVYVEVIDNNSDGLCFFLGPDDVRINKKETVQ